MAHVAELAVLRLQLANPPARHRPLPSRIRVCPRGGRVHQVNQCIHDTPSGTSLRVASRGACNVSVWEVAGGRVGTRHLVASQDDDGFLGTPQRFPQEANSSRGAEARASHLAIEAEETIAYVQHVVDWIPGLSQTKDALDADVATQEIASRRYLTPQFPVRDGDWLQCIQNPCNNPDP